MNHFKPDEFYQGVGAALEKALSAKRYHEVLLGGLSAYLYFREKEEKLLERGMLAYLRVAIDALSVDGDPGQSILMGQHECSFCGRREPDVRLAAGAKGFICDACVLLLGELFHPTPSS
jgi:hypothetical protein